MGFTFNGVTSRSMGIFTRMDKEKRIPDIRNLTEQVSGRHGLYDFGETLSERKIEIECLIPQCRSQTQLLQVKDNIIAWLNPDEGLGELVLDSEPGRVYYARLTDSLTYERIVRRAGEFTLTFLCPDPFAYASPDETYTLTGSADITRSKGNCDSPALYEITGYIADSSGCIRVTVNGEVMEIYGPLTSDETMQVDAKNMTMLATASDGTVRNALGQMGSLVFPYLKTGSNTVTAAVDGATLSAVQISARSRWL